MFCFVSEIGEKRITIIIIYINSTVNNIIEYICKKHKYSYERCLKIWKYLFRFISPTQKCLLKLSHFSRQTA